MERKNETLCWKHCTPQGTPFSPGRFCKLQSIAHNFPNFCHILIPPVLLFIFPHVFSFAEIPTVTSIYIIIPIKRDTQLPKKKQQQQQRKTKFTHILLCGHHVRCPPPTPTLGKHSSAGFWNLKIYEGLGLLPL